MIVSMIAAMGKNRIIGKDNNLPWHLPDDFKYFQKITKGHYVIMGRKNWDSLPQKFKPLPNRSNIVVTRQLNYYCKGADVVGSVFDGLEIARRNGEIEAMIIGGGEIYRIGLELADRIYLTEISGEFKGQVTFPEFDQKQWEEVSREHHPSDKKHVFSFDFVVYEKNSRY